MLLVTGSNGQLGSELHKLLPEAIFTDVNDLDITDKSAVDEFVNAHHIDMIINCAAYTAVDKAEEDVAMAEKINIKGPENLATTDAKLVHISTDYVFDGNGHRPYLPEDEAKPVSVYGVTKLAGEKAVLAHNKRAVIIRTAWLYSSFGNNFVKTMRRLGAEKASLNVVCDQVGTPTYAADLAEAIVKIIPQVSDKTSGVYHFTNEGVCSWYDFAYEIMQQSGLKCKVMPILSAEYPTKANRPFYSVLDKNKIKQTFGLEIRHWKEGLEECLKQF